MALGAVNKLGRMAADTGIPTPRRLFASTIVLMTYTSMRFADFQPLRGFGAPFAP